jgi:hypothetical protein
MYEVRLQYTMYEVRCTPVIESQSHFIFGEAYIVPRTSYMLIVICYIAD